MDRFICVRITNVNEIGPFSFYALSMKLFVLLKCTELPSNHLNSWKVTKRRKYVFDLFDALVVDPSLSKLCKKVSLFL